MLVFIGFVISLYGIYQYFYGIPTNYAWVDKKMFTDLSVRVYSVFSNPNVLGQYLVLMTPLAAGMMWIRKDKLEKFVYCCITSVMLVCLVLTSSRGAWLGMLLAMAVFIYLKDKRLIVLGVLLLIILPFFLPPSVISRFESIGNLKESSSAYRYSVWLGSIALIKHFWLAGIGIGTRAFEMIYPGYSVAGASYALHSHNFYLQLLTESGVIGFSVFAAMMVTFYRSMFLAVRRTREGLIYIFDISDFRDIRVSALRHV
jgi:O-antigen ligase